MRHCRKIARDDRASIKYGINRKSVLTQLKYFDICNGGLIPDLMHDMLEGLLPYETKLVLKHIVESRYVNLKQINHIIDSIELGYMETSNRPSTPIVLNMEDKPLKQNGKCKYQLCL